MIVLEAQRAGQQEEHVWCEAPAELRGAEATEPGSWRDLWQGPWCQRYRNGRLGWAGTPGAVGQGVTGQVQWDTVQVGWARVG